MLRKRKGVIVSLDRHRVQVLEGEVTGDDLAVQRFAQDSLPPTDEGDPEPEAVGGLVRTLLDKAGIRTDRAVVVLPGQQALVRSLLLPGGPQAELEQIIHFQAMKALPVGEGKLKVGYFLQNGPESKKNVTVVGVMRTVLDRVQAIMDAAELKAEGVTFSSLGAFNGFLAAYGPPRDGRDAAVVHVAEGSSDIAVIRGSDLVFQRSTASVGAAPLGAVGPWAERLGTELHLTLQTYRAGQRDREVGRVVLTGPSGPLSMSVAPVRERLSVDVEAPTTLAGKLRWEAGDATEAPEAFSMAGTLWAALGCGGLWFDVTADYFTQMGKKKSKATPYLAVGALVCVVAALFLVPDHFLKQRLKEVNDLKAEVTVLEKDETERVQTVEKKAEELKNWTRERGHWLDILLEIAQSKPEKKGQTSWGVYLTNLKLREGEPVRMNGRARSESDITNFARQIGRSTTFKSADATSYQKSARREDYQWTFEILAKLAEQE